MNLRLVSGLSETYILTLSQWENERFAVVNSQRTLSPVEERRAICQLGSAVRAVFQQSR